MPALVPAQLVGKAQAREQTLGKPELALPAFVVAQIGDAQVSTREHAPADVHRGHTHAAWQVVEGRALHRELQLVAGVAADLGGLHPGPGQRGLGRRQPVQDDRERNPDGRASLGARSELERAEASLLRTLAERPIGVRTRLIEGEAQHGTASFDDVGETLVVELHAHAALAAPAVELRIGRALPRSLDGLLDQEVAAPVHVARGARGLDLERRGSRERFVAGLQDRIVGERQAGVLQRLVDLLALLRQARELGLQLSAGLSALARNRALGLHLGAERRDLCQQAGVPRLERSEVGDAGPQLPKLFAAAALDLNQRVVVLVSVVELLSKESGVVGGRADPEGPDTGGQAAGLALHGTLPLGDCFQSRP